MDENPLFILAGNGPYVNRGCEAIVRGTAEIIKKYYRSPRFFAVSNFENKRQYLEQKKNEPDNNISHFKVKKKKKKKSSKMYYLLLDRLNPETLKKRAYRNLLKFVDDSIAVLSLGGDNYSLDYGIPKNFTDLDDLVIKKKKPIILWGASVGPFSKNIQYENYMKKHLKKINGIFARETETIRYLSVIGIEKNVYQVADPAFFMEPKKPKNIDLRIEKNSIGINLSPLMARFVMDGNIVMWKKRAKKIIEKISIDIPNCLYLIPHVFKVNNNDYLFLKDVYELLEVPKNNIFLVPPSFNAQEIKWIIGQMDFFAGARMHSTIASLSSYVPTLSFPYSIKSKGINSDIFGHQDYILDTNEITSTKIVKKMKIMLDNSKEIRNELKEKIPEMQKRSLRSGQYLKEIIDFSA